jgi:hypothetical protein
MKLLYLTDIRQLDYLLKENIELLKGSLILSGEIEIGFKLDQLNIDYLDEWKFLDEIEINENWNLAYKLSLDWWENLNFSETSNNYFKYTEQDCVWSFEAALNSFTVYSKVFNQYSFDEIYCFFEESIGVIRTGPIPVIKSVRTISNGILFWLAEKYNCKITRFNIDHNKYKRKKNSGILKIGKLNEKKLKYNSVLDPSVIVFVDGLSNSELKIIKEKLFSKYLTTIYLSESDLLNLNSNISTIIDKELYGSKYNDIYPFLFCNKFLQFQFDTIFEEINLANKASLNFAELLLAYNPLFVFFGPESFTLSRSLVNQARDLGFKTFGFIHGGLGFRCSHRSMVGDVDKILVWNEFDENVLLRYGTCRNRIVKIGSLRFEEKISNFNDIDKNNLIFDNNNPTILILTAAINAGFANPISNPIKHRLFYYDLINHAIANPNLNYLIKAHPSYDHYDLYRLIITHGPANIQYFEDLDLLSAISQSDIVVSVNYITSAIIDSFILKKPVIYYNNSVYELTDWLDDYSDYFSRRFDNFENLVVFIEKILTSEDIKNNIIQENDIFLNKIIYDIKASDNLQKIISDEYLIKKNQLPRFNNIKLTENSNAFIVGSYNGSLNKLIFSSSKFNFNYFYALIISYIRGSLSANSKISFSNFCLCLFYFFTFSALLLKYNKTNIILIVKYIRNFLINILVSSQKINTLYQ